MARASELAPGESVREFNDMFDAAEYAERGGVGLFCHEWTGGTEAPKPFRGTKIIGKLFSRNRNILLALGTRFGVKVIKVDRPGQRFQHIDLVGVPLNRAREAAAVTEVLLTNKLAEGANATE